MAHSDPQYHKKYYASNAPRLKRYAKENIVRSGLTSSVAGAASEHLVIYDLAMRGAIEITRPVDPGSSDDVHARFASGWYSFQVKTGKQNRRTGVLQFPHGPKDALKNSPHVLVLTNLHTKEVRYYAGVKELPEELSGQIHGAPHAPQP
jgi:hypothetical protein